MKKIFYLLLLSILISCSDDSVNDKQETKNKVILVEGSWRLEFALSEHNIAPVNFSLVKKDTSYFVEFSNADEKIIAKEVRVDNDIITIHNPIFNSWLEGDIINSTTIEGNWYKDGKDYYIPFTAEHSSSSRFPKPANNRLTSSNITGKWEVDFSKNIPKDHFKSIGQFHQDGDYLTGTFMTETGDYRYLEGNMYNDSAFLSCFDGSHLFLFKAVLKNDSLIGTFWSGTHWEEPWVAIRNESFELTNPDSLTYLKDGYSELAFTFPNLNRENVSLKDDKYNGKVVIVNIMGPWCPNCLDETAYLTELYNQNHDKGLEIIALSYDKSNNFDTSKQNILKVKTYYNSGYDFLIAGKADKIASAKSLPMLNHIMSYPTTIFIDRKGSVRKIRTGFYGPGTGSYYIKYTQEINDLIARLLAE
jgi:thiol-disulfide isomerase/thioredoxin